MYTIIRSINCVAILVVAVVTLTVHGAETSAPRVFARQASELSVAPCLQAVNAGQTPDAQQCPGFLIEALATTSEICREVGGVLEALQQADIWALDTDRDGAPEFAMEYSGVVACNGAWSVFSCGSLGCPKAMYRNEGGVWRMIGALHAGDAASVELLFRPDRAQADLRISRAVATPDFEHWYYEWQDQDPAQDDTGLGYYEPVFFEVRGFRVEFADSIHGLYALIGDTDVLAAPVVTAVPVGRYAAATDVAVVGTSADGAYFYVSPCNACESGFVARSAIRIP